VNVAALFSGGKDSTYAIYIAQQYGWDVRFVVSVIPEEHSEMFHYPNIELTGLLSESLGIPLITEKSGRGEIEELAALKRALQRIENIEGVITGAVASDYQSSRINRFCRELGLKTFSPLWRKDGEMLLRDMLGSGFEIIIVGVSAEGFDSSWLGKRLDQVTLDKILSLCAKHRINVCGEGGEFETLVLNAPNFRAKLLIEESEVQWTRDSGILTIKKASLDGM
jgi:ABC transporter with metal-binding/Fe-S-binding domain ATP-binding protein